MCSKLYFHDTYWPIRGKKKIVAVVSDHIQNGVIV